MSSLPQAFIVPCLRLSMAVSMLRTQSSKSVKRCNRRSRRASSSSVGFSWHISSGGGTGTQAASFGWRRCAASWRLEEAARSSSATAGTDPRSADGPELDAHAATSGRSEKMTSPSAIARLATRVRPHVLRCSIAHVLAAMAPPSTVSEMARSRAPWSGSMAPSCRAVELKSFLPWIHANTADASQLLFPARHRYTLKTNKQT
jgi:hypothetical protein